jgi:hypothetical protein
MAQSKQIDFNGQNIFIGIDVHLKTWSVTVLTPSGYKKGIKKENRRLSLQSYSESPLC